MPISLSDTYEQIVVLVSQLITDLDVGISKPFEKSLKLNIIILSAVLDGQRDERAGRLHPRPERGDQGAARGVALQPRHVMLQGAI